LRFFFVAERLCGFCGFVFLLSLFPNSLANQTAVLGFFYWVSWTVAALSEWGRAADAFFGEVRDPMPGVLGNTTLHLCLGC
jgi:hypothetical protein